MKRSIWQALALAFLLSTTALGMIGCSQSGPTPADITKVENDPKLSQAERDRLADKMAEEAENAQYAPNYGLIIGLLVAGVGIYVAGTIVRKRKLDATPTKAQKKATPGNLKKSPPPAAPVSNQALTFAPAEKRPVNQAEVEALGFDERGTSFFTGRPVPSSILVYVPIQVGNYLHRVMATEQEEVQVENGQIPMVRSFTVGSQTAPWYEWEDFNPYDHYWEAMDGDWYTGGDRAIACWLPLAECNPRLKGYYMAADGGGQLISSSGPEMDSLIDEIDEVEDRVTA